MRQMTPAERRASPGYARGMHMLQWFVCAATIAVVSGWVASRVLPADTPLAHGVWFRLVGALIPAVGVLASHSAEPTLASVVYGIEWFFAPVYLAIFFAGFPPWSKLMRSAVRYKVRLQQFGWPQKVLVVFGMVVLLLWFLGSLGIIPFPTLLNGGLIPPTDWLLPIYHSYLALAVFGAISATCECCVPWVLLVFAFNFDAYVLGRHLQTTPDA